MTVGRKPTPTALKLVKGNPGKRALPKSEAVVALSEPTPPAFLYDDAQGRVGPGVQRAVRRRADDRTGAARYWPPTQPHAVAGRKRSGPSIG